MYIYIVFVLIFILMLLYIVILKRKLVQVNVEVEILSRLPEILQSSINLNEVMNIVVDAVQNILGFRIVILSLVEDEGKWLRRVSAVGISSKSFDEIKKKRVPLSGFLEKTKKYKKMGSFYKIKKGHYFVPLESKEKKLLGVLEVENPLRKTSISIRKRVGIVNAVATSVSLAVDNARIYEDLKSTLLSIEVVYDVASIIGTIMTTGDLLNTIIEAIRSKLSYLNVAIFMKDRFGRLLVRAHTGYPDIEIEKIQKEIGPNKGVTAKALRENDALLVSDIREEPLYVGNKSIGKSEIAIPLLARGEPVGVLDVEKFGVNSLGERDLRLLKTLSTFISKALENAFLYEKVEKMAVTDGLTGAYNYRMLKDEIGKLIKESKLNGKTFSLLLMDVDNFKQLNDTLGHLKGDVVLKEIVNVIKRAVREDDTIIRYGGDEFVVVFPEVSKKMAIELGRRLIENINKDKRLRKLTEQSKIKISVSIGASSFPDDGKTVSTLLRKVDRAMYTAKRRGKSKILGA